MVLVSSFGAMMQWPIGYISDKIDRRVLLIAVTFIASALCILIVISSYISFLAFNYTLYFLFKDKKFVYII